VASSVCQGEHNAKTGSHCSIGNQTPIVMTRPLPFTKAKLNRALDVAREKGFRLLVKADGTLIFEKDNNSQAQEKPLEQGEDIVL
jgi:hypothetical protein